MVAVGWNSDERRQHAVGGDGESRPHARKRRCAGAVVHDHLPAGLGAALKADSDAAHYRGLCDHHSSLRFNILWSSWGSSHFPATAIHRSISACNPGSSAHK